MRHNIPGWQTRIDNLRYEQQETSKGIEEIKSRIASVKADILFKKEERRAEYENRKNRGGGRW